MKFFAGFVVGMAIPTIVGYWLEKMEQRLNSEEYLAALPEKGQAIDAVERFLGINHGTKTNAP